MKKLLATLALFLVASAAAAAAWTITPVATGTGDSAVLPALAGRYLVGWCAGETAGTPAAATFKLFHGDANNDPRLMPVELLANESRCDWIPGGGIPIPDGLYLDRTAGETEITFYTDLRVALSP